MGDPFFDGPHRPLISDAAVRWSCGTAMVLGAALFLHLHPELIGSVADFAGLCVVVLFFLWLSR